MMPKGTLQKIQPGFSSKYQLEKQTNIINKEQCWHHDEIMYVFKDYSSFCLILPLSASRGNSLRAAAERSQATKFQKLVYCSV